MKEFIAEKNSKLSDAVIDNVPGTNYNSVMKLLRKKEIKVNGIRVKSDVKVSALDKITVYLKDTADVFFSALYKDENVLVVNKKSGILSEDVFNKVKEEYVTRFMNLCIEYIYKMEQYRSQLNKIANKHNFKDLYEAIKSTRYINQEVSDFYNNFDEAFLHIYPNFLKDFNALLRPDAQVSPKKGERLNTELRIYALLKLGISASTKVQEFLRCSSSTVYNYRTNMRNKAINRDTFEQDVLNL